MTARIGGGGDALGFGEFPGQYAMVVLSRFPIDREHVRTFRKFLWRDMPGALLPDKLETPLPFDWYSPEELAVLPLSSKSHWDVPVRIGKHTLHLLVSHPTPPAFDGPEDRNGLRNHDEIRFWSDYLSPRGADYIRDDSGRRGGFAGRTFVIMGDQNSDPEDGASRHEAIRALLSHARVDGRLRAAQRRRGRRPRKSRAARTPASAATAPPIPRTSTIASPATCGSTIYCRRRDLTVCGQGIFWPAADRR